MKKQVINTFNRLEKQRNEIISRLKSLSKEELEFKPDPNSWNVLQVVLHLLKSEQLATKYMSRRMSTGKKLHKAGIGSVIRSKLLQIGLFLPVKYIAPKMVDVTGHTPEFDTIKSDWKHQREKLKDLIESCDDETFRKELFRHPRAGDMNLLQALEFMEMHTSHHQKQIERILSVIDHRLNRDQIKT